MSEPASAPSDKELIKRFLENQDESSFADLVKRHQRVVFGVCQRILKGSADAEEACQATFLILAEKADKIRDQDHLGSWLYGVALRVTKQHIRMNIRRKNREHQFVEEETRNAIDPDRPGNKEFLEQIDGLVSRLPKKFQEVIVSHYFEERSYADVAGRLGLSESTVRGRLEQARKRLHRMLISRGYPAALTVTGLGTMLKAEAAASSSALTGINWAKVSTVAAVKGKASSPIIVQLAQQTIFAMKLTKINTTMAAVIIVGLFTGGSYLLISSREDKQGAIQNDPPEKSLESAIENPPPPMVSPDTASKKISAKSLEEAFFIKDEQERWKVVQTLGVDGITLEQVNAAVARAGQSKNFVGALYHILARGNPEAFLKFASERGVTRNPKFAYLFGDAFLNWYHRNPSAALATVRKYASGTGIEKMLQTHIRMEDSTDPLTTADGILKGMTKANLLPTLKGLANNWPSSKLDEAMSWNRNSLDGEAYDIFLKELAKGLARREPEEMVTLSEGLANPEARMEFLAAALPVIGATNPQSAAELATKIEDSYPRRGEALYGLAKAWTETDQIAAIDWVNQLNDDGFTHGLQGILETADTAFMTDLSERFLGQEDDREVERAFLDASANIAQEGRPAEAANMITRILKNHPQAVVRPENGGKSIAHQISSTDLKTALWNAVYWTADNLSRSDEPDQVVEWLDQIQFENAESRLQVMETVVKKWSRTDESGAREWMDTLELSSVEYAQLNETIERERRRR